MFLVIAGSLAAKKILWGWAVGRERPYLKQLIVTKVAPGVYLFKEDDLLKRIIIYAKARWGKDYFRVMRVTDDDVDFDKPLVPGPDDKVKPKEGDTAYLDRG